MLRAKPRCQLQTLKRSSSGSSVTENQISCADVALPQIAQLVLAPEALMRPIVVLQLLPRGILGTEASFGRTSWSRCKPDAGSGATNPAGKCSVFSNPGVLRKIGMAQR